VPASEDSSPSQARDAIAHQPRQTSAALARSGTGKKERKAALTSCGTARSAVDDASVDDEDMTE